MSFLEIDRRPGEKTIIADDLVVSLYVISQHALDLHFKMMSGKKFQVWRKYNTDRVGQEIQINAYFGEVLIKVRTIGRLSSKIGFNADESIKIWRKEIWDNIQLERTREALCR